MDSPHAQRATIVLLAIAALMPLCIARSQLLTGDPTYYIGLTESLVAGNGYTFMGERHTIYPPGLPVLLSPVVALFGRNVLATQVWVAMFAVIAAITVYALLRAIAPALRVPILAATVLGYPYFALATATVRAELPFLAVTAAGLWLVYRAAAASARWPTWLLVVGTALLGAATVMLRTIGVAFPLAMLFAWGHRRIRNVRTDATDATLAAGGLGGLLAAVWWAMWTRGSSASYGTLLRLQDPHQPDLGQASIAEIIARIPDALATQLGHVAMLPSAGHWTVMTWYAPTTLGLALCLVAGALRLLGARNPVVAWYVLGYVGILLIWPFDEGARFIVPILPVLLVVLASGLATCVPTLESLLYSPATEDGTSPLVASHRRVIVFASAAIVAAFATASLVISRGAVRSLSTAQALLLGAEWIAVVVMVVAHRGQSARVDARTLWRGLGWGVAGLFVVANGVRTVGQARLQLRGADLDPAALRPAFTWMEAHLPAHAVVLSEFPSAVYFYTGRRARLLPPTAHAETLIRALHDARASYVLVQDPTDYPYYLPTQVDRLAVMQRAIGADAFDVAHRYPTGTLYHVRPVGQR